MAQMHQKIQDANPEVRYGVTVPNGGITRKGSGYEVKTSEGVISALRVVIAIGGGLPRKLGKDVKIDAQADIRYSIIDGVVPKNKNVIVNGAGNMALEVVTQLVNEGNKVTLVYRGDKLKKASPKNKENIQKLEDSQQIIFLRNTNPKEVGRGYAVFVETTKSKGADGKEVKQDGEPKKLDCDVYYCLLGQVPNDKWLGSIGIEFIERPVTEDIGRTDEPEFLKKL